jgi:hypothetical protein
MSTKAQALRAPGRVVSPERSSWRLVVAGFVALLLALTTLVVLATVNAPTATKGGADHGARNVTSRGTGVDRVGGDGPYKYHPLP